MRDLPKLTLNLKQPKAFGNVAEKLGDSERRVLASDLIELIRMDENSMSDWLGEAEGFLKNVEAESSKNSKQTSEAQGSNEDASPSTELTLTAVIQFSARATDALLGEPDLAQASEPGGEQLAEWVSNQVRSKDPNWILDTDPLIVHMAVTGLAWRKRDFDEDAKTFRTSFIPSAGSCKVIIPAGIRSIERAPRVAEEFELYPYEIERLINRKTWVDYKPRYDERDPQAPKKFYELDAWLDLDGDDIDEPWTVVISRDDTPEVVRIRPRWSAKTIISDKDTLMFNAIHRFYPYRFLPDPKGGFLPMGFGKLLTRTEATADNLLSSIVSTAKTEALNAGVMAGGGIGMPTSLEISDNRVTSIPTDGAPLTNRFQSFPVKQVSPGSVQALEKIMALGDRLAGTLNLLANAPASMTATMAKGIIDNGTQIQSAVHRRLVTSLTQEFHMLVAMADAYGVLPDGVSAASATDVAVTADPQLATEMQRGAMAEIYMQLASDPFTDPKEVRERLYRVLRLPNPDKLFKAPQGPQVTPDEKMKGTIALLKQRTENIKVTGAVAVQLTQALLNMVEAAGGMQNNQAALLTMAQLENAVQQMISNNGDIQTGLSDVAGGTGNPNAGALPAPAPAGGAAQVPQDAGAGIA